MFNQENILANYLHEVNRYPKLTSFEEFWLFQKYNAGDENAKKFLIECNLRLVLLRVKKYYKSSEFMDIVQEGNLGLIKAIEKYEITKGKFSTFAISYIDGYIKNYFNNDKNQLYISNNLRLAVERYKKLVLLYNQEGKSIPDDKELCTLLSISLKQIQQVKKIVNFSFVRLNDLNKDGKENESFISDNEIFSDQLSKQKELLIGLKMLLKPYHYYIIYHRYLTSPKVKLHVLAETLGVKGESVRIGEVNALKELKNYMKNDQEIFESKLYKLQQKEGKLFNKINTRPVHPADITKFLYAKNHLNELEQKLFKLIYFGKYCFNEIEAASFLKIPFETYQDLFRALELKLQDIFEDHMQYESFHRQMVDQHKSKIFSLNLDAKVIDKNYLNSSYENFSFEELQQKFGTAFESLSLKEQKVLERSFGYKKIRDFNKDLIECGLGLSFGNMTRDEIIQFIKINYKYINKAIRDELMALFQINEFCVMTDAKRKSLLEILDKLEKDFSKLNVSRRLENSTNGK